MAHPPAVRATGRHGQRLAGDRALAPSPPSPGKGGHGIRRAGEDDEALLARVRGFLADHPSVDVDVTWQVRE